MGASAEPGGIAPDIVARYRPTPATRYQRAFYAVCRTAVELFCRAFWRVTVVGKEHVPAMGPFILSPVHRSNVDTPLAAVVTHRRLRYMGKDAMWKYKWSAWFFTSAGGFPVRRGTADREALRTCMEVIAGGEPLVMFPEGTRQSGPDIEELFDGPAYVACRTGAPIVPVGIGGSEAAMPRGKRFLRPVKVVLVVGEPIHPPAPSEGGRVSRRAVRELSDQLKVELQKLFDDAQARAGRPNRR
jgi:1-acyl-sn-glycerol-3-phosphate acyltransferase